LQCEFSTRDALERRCRPLGGLDGGGVPSRCCEEQFVVRERRCPSELLLSLDAFLSKGLLVGGRKVDRFVEVESVVEARVVGLRESNHELTGSVIERIVPNTDFLEMRRCKQGDQLEQ
jgi:hypothetical protein